MNTNEKFSNFFVAIFSVCECGGGGIGVVSLVFSLAIFQSVEKFFGHFMTANKQYSLILWPYDGWHLRVLARIASI